MSQIVHLFLEIKGIAFDDKMTKLALKEWVTEMGDRPLSQYKRIHAQEFVNSFAARGKSSGTAKRRIGALKAAMRKVAVMHELDIKPLFDGVELEGIGAITIEDIRNAADMGYKIKLLGVTQMTGRGLEQRMSPCLVPATSPLGQLVGGTNMVVLEGDAVGQIVLRGAGAGEAQRRAR